MSLEYRPAWLHEFIMKRKQYKNEGYTLSGCVTLVAVVGQHVADHSTSKEGWCVDYDPDTDTCFSYYSKKVVDPFEFEV